MTSGIAIVIYRDVVLLDIIITKLYQKMGGKTIPTNSKYIKQKKVNRHKSIVHAKITCVHYLLPQ